MGAEVGQNLSPHVSYIGPKAQTKVLCTMRCTTTLSLDYHAAVTCYYRAAVTCYLRNKGFSRLIRENSDVTPM